MAAASHFLRCATGNDFTTIFASAGTQIDDPVTRGCNLHIVGDCYNCAAAVDQEVELSKKALDIAGVQSRRGLIEDVQRLSARGALQFSGKLHSLRFASREFGRRLPETKES